MIKRGGERRGRKTVKENAVESDKHRQLDYQKKDSRKRVHLMLFVERHHRFGLLGLVRFVFRLNGFQLRLQSLHDRLLAALLWKKGKRSKRMTMVSKMIARPRSWNATVLYKKISA